jgi:hypothetical protein
MSRLIIHLLLLEPKNIQAKCTQPQSHSFLISELNPGSHHFPAINVTEKNKDRYGLLPILAELRSDKQVDKKNRPYFVKYGSKSCILPRVLEA